jgi:hypothetical protein
VDHAPEYFISYNKADAPWAKWVASVLDEERHSFRIQAWDFRPGQNFVLEMHKALQTSRSVLALVSPDYLSSSFCQPEWAAAFATDPEGWLRRLIPVRIRECRPEGLLGPIIYVDLVGLGEVDARRRLLEGIDPNRIRPRTPPPFPGEPG